ncbi:protein cornichon homolog 4-like [Hydractinia symbiolongicarpus]|uniref:protein cornichon homolog 4-like n=1 Tax=Hydractinia symbiolongicarpus TaxID=13093 RepID=UPI00254BD98A|nr:protein cornichon homolog 4-like [Hydractinia symbiolongicarpus]
MGATVVYVFGLIDSTVLLFMAVFYIVTLSDLECDHINAATCCGRLNKIIIPEAALLGLLNIALIFNGSFALLAFSLPMFVWLIYRIAAKPKGNIAYFDPAEIYNRQQVKTFTNEAIVKLMYHLFGFFVFLYCMIMELVSDDDNSMHPFPPLPHEGM